MPFDFGSIGSGLKGTFVGVGLTIAIGLITLIIALFGFWALYNRKKWNIKVEIKLPRSDGKIVIGEWGKGNFNAKRGVCFIKRRGGLFNKAIPMMIFDIRKYLQGSDLLTVIQLGPEDYRPVLNTSWLKHDVEYEEYDDKTGKKTGETKTVKESILNIKVDTGLNKAWKSAWEEAARQAYTLKSFLQQFQTPIAIGIVILCCFVGFAILWTRIG